MINFTESARKKVAEMTAESSPGKLLRIFVEPGGCSGFEYGMSIDEPKPTDRVGDFSGVGYAVDADSLDYLTGCEIHLTMVCRERVLRSVIPTPSPLAVAGSLSTDVAVEAFFFGPCGLPSALILICNLQARPRVYGACQ